MSALPKKAKGGIIMPLEAILYTKLTYAMIACTAAQKPLGAHKSVLHSRSMA